MGVAIRLCRSLTYCELASAVTALKSLDVASPDVPQIYPFKVFTEENFFTDEVRHIRRPVEVEKNGNTLDQLATMLAAFEVDVESVHAGDLTLEAVRRLLTGALQRRRAWHRSTSVRRPSSGRPGPPSRRGTIERCRVEYPPAGTPAATVRRTSAVTLDYSELLASRPRATCWRTLILPSGGGSASRSPRGVSPKVWAQAPELLRPAAIAALRR